MINKYSNRIKNNIKILKEKRPERMLIYFSQLEKEKYIINLKN
jgi:hypothetical protein